MSFGDVIVLFGGTSSERRVSVASAQHMASQLPGVRAWFESPMGEVFEISEGALAAFERPFETDFTPGIPPRFSSVAAALDSPLSQSAIFLLGYHGTFGEDGQVQALLEKRSLAFTGSGSLASAKAFDKAWAKRLVAEEGVRCAEAVELPQGELRACSEALLDLLARHGRVVAKPLAGGSSVGLHHLRTADDVGRAGPQICSATEPYLAEAFIEGTEVTIGVVDLPRGSMPFTAATATSTSTAQTTHSLQHQSFALQPSSPGAAANEGSDAEEEITHRGGAGHEPEERGAGPGRDERGRGRGGLRSHALPVTEVRIDPGRAFDFEGKYLGKGTLEITPAELPAQLLEEAQAMALIAHRKLGCYGYSRTDVICSPRGPVFLEINTLPGMTRRSFIPQQLAAEGTSVRSFLEGQLALAKERAASLAAR